MEIELMDKSGYSIVIKLTEQYAQRFNCAQHDLYQIHNVKVTVFGSPNDSVPQRRLVRVMRCNHHETESVPTPVPSNDQPEIVDFDDDDDELISCQFRIIMILTMRVKFLIQLTTMATIKTRVYLNGFLQLVISSNLLL